MPSQDETNTLIRHYLAGALSVAETYALSMTRKYPDYQFGWKAYGAILSQMGQNEASLAPFEKAIQLEPEDAEAHNNIGVTLRKLNRLHDACFHFRAAISYKPDYAEALNNLGNVLIDLGSLHEAEKSLREAIRLKPTYTEAHSNLGNLLKELGRIKEAKASYQEAIRISPDYAVAHSNIGNILLENGRISEAEESYRKSIELNPSYAEGYYNLGNALLALGHIRNSEASFREAIRLMPDFVMAYNNLGNTLLSLGCFKEAEENYREAMSRKTGNSLANSNLLFSLSYVEELPISDALEEARRYGAWVSAKATPKYSRWNTVSDPSRLRIGLVSGDLRSHPVGYFLEGLVREIDQSRCELLAYSTNPKSDELTDRIKPYFKDWVFIGGMSDQQVAQLIHEQALHILIDLAGHTADNRLPVFAYRPAPIQVTWLGYFATTGLPEMDFILANPYVIPPEEEGHFTEKVWRLPQTSLCFTPPSLPLEVSSLPALANGYITFGCFNTMAKMNERVILVWSDILKQVPGSKLFLKAKQFADQKVVSDVLAAYGKHGIPPERLIMEGPSKREAYLAAYNRMDIALDPFPFPGGTTSVEGLWMGVPVLTLKGDRFISHQGEAIAHNVGLTDWIAEDTDDYVAKAVQLSTDIQSLATLRSTLRPQLLNSPMCDAKRFARHFEEAMWGMWEEYMKGKAS